MKTTFILFLIAALLGGCASRQKQEQETRAVWTRVQVAIANRDVDAAKKELNSLGTHATVKSPDGDYWHLKTSDLERGIEQTIVNLRRCDGGVKRKSLDDIRRCGPPNSPDEKTFLTTWLSPYSQKYPDTLHTDFSSLETTFKAEAEKISQEQQVESQRRAQKEKEDAARAEADERKSIEEMKLAEERKEKDPKTWLERACGSYDLINRSKDLIKQEKEGAKYSGVVNQATLHGAGQTIAFIEKQLEKQKDEFKRHSGGKAWSPTLCK